MFICVHAPTTCMQVICVHHWITRHESSNVSLEWPFSQQEGFKVQLQSHHDHTKSCKLRIYFNLHMLFAAFNVQTMKTKVAPAL